MGTIAWPSSRLGAVLSQLDHTYGPCDGQSFENPFEMLLWEKVAYLADDAKRTSAYRTLRDDVGLTPTSILAASFDRLVRICRLGGSVEFEARAERMAIAASLVMSDFGGDLSSVLALPAKQAIKELRRFLGVGVPGAETILLTFGVLPVLALESNGIRVLTRLGFGEESPNYSATYKSVREAVSDELPADCALLLSAHRLLRRHGQELCKSGGPRCEICPVNRLCAFYGARPHLVA